MSRDRGQAAIETALGLPIVVMLVLGVIQVVSIGRAQLAVELAAREGARAAAVAANPAAVAEQAAMAATDLRPLAVAAVVATDRVTVNVSYTSDTDVAVVGAAIPDVTVEASVTMQREPP